MVTAAACLKCIEADESLKDSTKAKHVLALRTMAADRGIPDGAWELLYQGAVEYVRGKYANPGTSKGKLETLVKLYRACPAVRARVPDKAFEELHAAMAADASLSDKAFTSGKNRKLDEKGKILWSDVVAAEERLVAAQPGSQEQVYFSLMTRVYVPRNEPRTIRVAETRQDAAKKFAADDNVLLLRDRKLLLRSYKTAKTYGEVEFDVPADLVDHARAMLAARAAACAAKASRSPPQVGLGTQVMSHLFYVEKTCKPHTASSFSQWVARASLKAVGKPYTANEYRHVYASNLSAHATNEEIERSARKMLHSVEKHLNYRNDDILEKREAQDLQDKVMDPKQVADALRSMDKAQLAEYLRALKLEHGKKRA